VAKCGSCGYDVVTTFRPTSEFFGPTIDWWWETLRALEI
jgi:hypothetical protein